MCISKIEARNSSSFFCRLLIQYESEQYPHGSVNIHLFWLRINLQVRLEHNIKKKLPGFPTIFRGVYNDFQPLTIFAKQSTLSVFLIASGVVFYYLIVTIQTAI